MEVLDGSYLCKAVSRGACIHGVDSKLCMSLDWCVSGHMVQTALLLSPSNDDEPASYIALGCFSCNNLKHGWDGESHRQICFH